MTIVKDNTKLVQAEYDKTLHEMQEIMLASISLDMRTPLNTIISMHSLVERMITDDAALKWLQVSQNSSSLLLSLVNDILDYF